MPRLRLIAGALLGVLLAPALPAQLPAQLPGADEAMIRPSSGFAQQTLSGAATHLVLGRSMLVGAAHRLTRVYVTNPAVLEAYTSGPRQVLVTAKSAGVSSLVVWDESGGFHSYLISADINIGALRASLKQALPHETIHAEGIEGCITLSGTVSTAAVADAAMKMASLYSKEVSNALVVNSSTVQQVKLKVRIVSTLR